jgi:hypothetical protein
VAKRLPFLASQVLGFFIIKEHRLALCAHAQITKQTSQMVATSYTGIFAHLQSKSSVTRKKNRNGLWHSSINPHPSTTNYPCQSSLSGVVILIGRIK